MKNILVFTISDCCVSKSIERVDIIKDNEHIENVFMTFQKKNRGYPTVVDASVLSLINCIKDWTVKPDIVVFENSRLTQSTALQISNFEKHLEAKGKISAFITHIKRLYPQKQMLMFKYD